ncbi:molybdopterin biosynthesis protein [Brevibacillus agri]|uniref:Molybdopterin molybdenumtransferase n=1 Tax=Brevibacillus agri TaxID=51101 RepID=A0A3M8AP83_9BACL|nr:MULTISPECIES: molybdopterin-binding protein [Brevibacillus]MBG9566388.1 molybdopterin-binding protein [Brevibacillus agri]MBY0054399.1 molybdopterin-binding protein [Brevibacillus agri]MED1645441.1 molybdopterin-binding protein [Brevibacillus agri]MED1656568.1 molybdopterin-binding protein [Brevibacillus agri]MED1686563.1 molybdopterin-binding protein [Brevibacillus agri]
MVEKPKMREVPVREAIGMMLPHDMTQILPGEFKGRLFKKGHVITEADIEPLLSIGKEHIYVLEMPEGFIHEEEAGIRIAKAVSGQGLTLTPPYEGKVSMKASRTGLAKVNEEAVHAINALEGIAFSTMYGDQIVHPGHTLAATRIIPLIIEEERIVELEKLAKQFDGPIIEVKLFQEKQVGLVTTGSEVFSGRIEDKFGAVIRNKVEALGSTVVDQRFAPDDKEAIEKQILSFLDEGVDLVLVTGGMSVDPDDRTPGAIAGVGAEVVRYGTPMLPGSMLMVAYKGDVPILGLPGAVMHEPFTSFDVFLPRILAGERIVASDMTRLGYGGLRKC